MHAYQPRRIFDGYKLTEIIDTVAKTIVDREIKEVNWFRVMLVPASVYDEIIALSDGRSINIEPITLHWLRKINRNCFETLLNNFHDQRTEIVFSSYSHPIYPIFFEENKQDLEVNIVWSICSLLNELSISKEDIDIVSWWLSECAYSKDVVLLIERVVKEILGKKTLLFILDQFQSTKGKVGFFKIKDTNSFVALRHHELSDVFSFENNYERFVEKVIEATRSTEIIGIASDAENYGGAYIPDKPMTFRKFDEWLKRNEMKNSVIHRKTLPVLFSTIKESKKLEEIELIDDSSWSDYKYYEPSKKLNFWIFGVNLGSLSRWRGYTKIGDKKVGYFIFYMGYKNNHKYLRITNSFWKIAFMEIRNTLANIVSRHVREILREKFHSSDPNRVLYEFWKIVFNVKSSDELLKEMHKKGFLKIDDFDFCSKLFSEISQAYIKAVQDSRISCPTFWEDFENELVQTSLALIIGGLVHLKNAFALLHDSEKVKEIQKLFSDVFVNFEEENLWFNVCKKVSLPIDELIDKLAELASTRSQWNLHQELKTLSRKDKYEEKVKIAKEIFVTLINKAFPVHPPIYPKDVNPYIILYIFYRHTRNDTLAIEEYKKALH
ncbi:MAG: hypothetical protein J7L47_10720, partial [Candidatus Odinarchaeota archaeon]|nr:hypothetical protein [Candidatus Odinarchaeota archaeon]